MKNGEKKVLMANGVFILYDEVIKRDKTNLDIFSIKDKSLTDLENLSGPDILANENIEAGLNSYGEIMKTINADLN